MNTDYQTCINNAARHVRARSAGHAAMNWGHDEEGYDAYTMAGVLAIAFEMARNQVLDDIMRATTQEG